VAIEYRWAEGHYDRLPALAADLVRRQVKVIASLSGIPSAAAAKAATTRIPIVFNAGIDPVEFSVAKSQAICQFSRSRSSTSSSISRPQRHSAWTFRQPCWPSPTRSSNDSPPRLHHASRRRGGGVAARCARAAAEGAGRRIRSLSSICRPQGCSASKFRHRCSPSPTRLSSECAQREIAALQ
jgi:hypothetical protein